MAAATNQQVQQYANERIRIRAEQLRALYTAIQDDKISIDDVYLNVSGSSTWVDERTDAPPKLLAPNDVLAYNAFITALLAFFDGDGNWDTVRSACVHSL